MDKAEKAKRTRIELYLTDKQIDLVRNILSDFTDIDMKDFEVQFLREIIDRRLEKDKEVEEKRINESVKEIDRLRGRG